MKKPHWLDKKIDLEKNREVKTLLRGLSLNTVCESALCPNISECFGCGIATIMIMGASCTRSCAFCAVDKSRPLPLDCNEPERVKEAALKLKLNYLVITSPTRDDLPDGGAGHFSHVVSAVKELPVKVEILVPDFLGRKRSFDIVASCMADVVAHNIETVPFLYNRVRQGADYKRSLGLLRYIKETNPDISTKSGIMLGLGETIGQVVDVMRDLRLAGTDILTIGQYLAPSVKHYPVQEYIAPEVFHLLKSEALKLGFSRVQSSPYTRSSYLAAGLT